MPDMYKLEILRLIGEDPTPGKIQRFSFNTISKKLQLTKDKLETFLTELNKDRFIAQYAKKGVDSFTVEIRQKGLDAIQDESFI
jgi:DNA-binding IclR family transcriptional regulator